MGLAALDPIVGVLSRISADPALGTNASILAAKLPGIVARASGDTVAVEAQILQLTFM